MQFDPIFYQGSNSWAELNDKSWWYGCSLNINTTYCLLLRDYGKA